jgi:GT2 family glycosyltransferase
MKSIAVLLTVHNRKEKTLECLSYMYQQKIPEGYYFDVYLTNDGCTDGTPDAVKQHYPFVNIINGDGNLYWNRGMHLAWKNASENKDYDYYLWLNDDTYLVENAIYNTIEDSKKVHDNSIICGATLSLNHENITYSGRLNNKILIPNDTLQECNIINGNYVLVPKIIFKIVGNLDWRFRHAIGDFDYGLRVVKKGYKIYLAGKIIGYCDENKTLPKWCLSTTPIIERFKILYSPLGYAEPLSFFIYEKRHFGIYTAIKHFISINLRALIPTLWK